MEAILTRIAAGFAALLVAVGVSTAPVGDTVTTQGLFIPDIFMPGSERLLSEPVVHVPVQIPMRTEEMPLVETPPDKAVSIPEPKPAVPKAPVPGGEGFTTNEITLTLSAGNGIGHASFMPRSGHACAEYAAFTIRDEDQIGRTEFPPKDGIKSDGTQCYFRFITPCKQTETWTYLKENGEVVGKSMLPVHCEQG